MCLLWNEQSHHHRYTQLQAKITVAQLWLNKLIS